MGKRKYLKMAQDCSVTFCDSEYVKHAGVCEKEAFKALCTPGTRDGFTSMEFFMCGGFMFLLGILVAVVAMAVIRTQQCFPRNNAEEQQLGEETQDTEEPLNRTMADF